MTVDQATIWNDISAEIERHAGDRLDDSITTAFKETFIEDIHPETESLASLKRSICNGLVCGSIPRMMESRRLDSYLGTRMSNPVASIIFTESVIRRIIISQRFITPVTLILRNYLHDQL